MRTIASFPDPASAEAAAALLRAHGILVSLEPRDAFTQAMAPGVRLAVPEDQLRRVRWLVDTSDLGGAEFFFEDAADAAAEHDAATAAQIARARSVGNAMAALGLGVGAVAILLAIVRLAFRD